MTRCEIETLLCQAIAKRLKRDASEIDPEQDFSDMGMKSLDAVVVSGVLEDELGFEVDPSVLFENRTARGVGDVLAQMCSA